MDMDQDREQLAFLQAILTLRHMEIEKYKKKTELKAEGIKVEDDTPESLQCEL